MTAFSGFGQFVGSMADNTLAVEHVTEFARRRNSLKRRIDLGIAVIGIGDLKTALGVARNTITAEIQFAFFEGHVLTDEAITQIALLNFQIHAHRVEHGFVKLGKVVRALRGLRRLNRAN